MEVIKMLRQNIINVVNRLAATSKSLNLDVMYMYNLIFDYQKKTRKPIFKMDIELKNGVLYIDSKAIEHVDPLIRPFNIDNPEADYYENRILSRSENYNL